MPLISCKIHLELNWIEDCISSSARNSAKFKITDATFHVPIVNLSTTDNINLTKQLSDGFNIGLLCIEIIYFDSIGTEHIPKEIDKFIGHKNIKTNIFRIPSTNSIMCGYFYIGVIHFMLAGKTQND